MRQSSPASRLTGQSGSRWRLRRERRATTGSRCGCQCRPGRACAVRRARGAVLGQPRRFSSTPPAESGAGAIHCGARQPRRTPRGGCRLRWWTVVGVTRPRRRAGHGDRPGARHGRGGAVACRRGRACDRLPGRLRRGARAGRARSVRCGHLHGDAGARARSRRNDGDPRPAPRSGRCAVRLDPQPQPQVVSPRDRRRRVHPATHSARHPRIRASHPSGGAGALGTCCRSLARRAGRDRVQSPHRSRCPERRCIRELPGAFHPVSPALIILCTLAGTLVGLLFGALFTQLRAARRIEALRVELASAQARLEASILQEADRLSLFEQSETRLRAAFDSLAGETLRTNSELFLRLAREALGRDQVIAQGALKERELAIAQLVEPLRTALERTEAQVQALERERRDAFSALRTQIETLAGGQVQLQRETRNLVTALRRPEVRGRWGELTLRRLVELAGLSEHCDFTEQLQLVGEEGALRPDLVVHMPDARDLVIDAKTPLEAYLSALEAATEDERTQALRRHAQQVETRVRELASKGYWSQFERSPEFAVLFLPGDQFLSAALAERPELLETALSQSVIIATPSTLIALLKAVAYGWRQSAVAHNAAQIRDLGQELYRRLSTFNGHLGRMGQRLSTAVEAYNAAVGSLERQVLPQARRFTELGVTADAPVPVLEPITELTRSLQSAAGTSSVDAAAAEALADVPPVSNAHVNKP